jgi:hypothetical protein
MKMVLKSAKGVKGSDLKSLGPGVLRGLGVSRQKPTAAGIFLEDRKTKGKAGEYGKFQERKISLKRAPKEYLNASRSS